MGTLTIKLTNDLQQALEQASRRAHLTKSELVRRALAAYVNGTDGKAGFVSALEQAGDLVGCFSGGPDDLASDPRHMDGFGRV